MLRRFCLELVNRNLKFVREAGFPVAYKVLTYLKLAKLQVGLLVNFNVLRLKDGIRRRIV
jgi:PD-(D/E)XK nuclease superfamily